MPTKQERIQKLKNQAAEARQTAETKEEQARQLEVEHRKVQANRNRKDESRAKVLLGVALLSLRNRVPVPSLGTMLSVLIPRDQEFLAQWCQFQAIDFNQSPVGSGPANELSKPESKVESGDSKVGDALKNILEGLDEGEFGLIAPDILDHASADQRVILEPWLAMRNSVQPNVGNTQSHTSSDQPESVSPHDSSEQPENNSSLQDSDKKSVGENAEVDGNGNLNEDEKLDLGAPIAGRDKNL